MKTCTKCDVKKSLELFYKRGDFKHLYKSSCKECDNLKFKKYEKTSPTRQTYIKTKRKEITQQWVKSNKGKVDLCRQQWRDCNRNQLNLQKRERYHSDINFKLKDILRVRLKEAIKNNQKSGSAVTDLGCSIDYLKEYLESKFQPDMTWKNWSRDGWHIDHIIPLNSFDLTDRSQFLKACHYTNLQPLWAKDNLKKGCKV